MATRAPKFTAKEVEGLKSSYGLTDPQVFWLQQRLGAVRDCLGPHTPMEDVRGELLSLKKDVDLAAKRVGRWTAASRPSAAAEALGHLNMASLGEGTQHPEDGVWPQFFVASELIDLVRRLVDAAAQGAPNSRRARNPASADAIDVIVQAIRRPEDDCSRAAAASLEPSYSDLKLAGQIQGRSGLGFSDLVAVVFAAVHRSLHKDGEPASAKPSIEAYLKRKSKLGLAKKPGRPPKQKV